MIHRVQNSKVNSACTRAFELGDPQKHEDEAIFKENQQIRMFL